MKKKISKAVNFVKDSVGNYNMCPKRNPNTKVQFSIKYWKFLMKRLSYMGEEMTHLVNEGK